MKEETGLGRGSLWSRNISDTSERKEGRVHVAERTSDCNADLKMFRLTTFSSGAKIDH